MYSAYVFRVAFELTHVGLHQLLEKRTSAGSLDQLRNDDGSIHCVFLCCDLPYQYLGEYFDKLDAERFHPITNKARVPKLSMGSSWGVNSS